MSLIFAFLPLSILTVLAQPRQLPIVSIRQGVVIGSIAGDGDYFEFHGIPYADSTSGVNRFKAPLPPPVFQTPFTANRKGVKCIRALGMGYEGTEDCLVVNVFTPALSATARLPVMVWIKGKELDDAYEQELSFSNFMDSQVVVVSLNFRESIMGFLCLGTEEAPGNAGLKDIIAGLRWIKENIAQFGGDPDNVSLFGHGSGGAAVDLVSLSPMADNLVHKVIAQSGTALSPWAVTRDNLKYAIVVAEGLGHTITDIQSLIDAFKRTSVAALMAVINELDLTDNSLAFSPCIEKEDLENGEPFLTKSPFTILTEGNYQKIPFMTGFVDHEGTIRAEEAFQDDWLQKMEESFSDFVQPDLHLEKDENGLQVQQYIRSFYFGNQSIDVSQINNFISYHGDTMILVSALREARLRASTSESPVYLYQFSYKGVLGESFVGPVIVNSAAHSEELAYLFYHETDVIPSEMDLTVSDILVNRWTNFAKNGVPETESSQIVWKPFTTENSNYLRILDDEELNEDQGGSLEVDLEKPHPETLAFWDGIYSDYFVDAEGKWNLEERLEEDDEEIDVDESDSGNGEGSGEGNDEDSGEGNDEDSGEGSGQENEEGIEEDGDVTEDNSEDEEGNSASRIFGCTFLIISFYSILSKFHMSSLMTLTF